MYDHPFFIILNVAVGGDWPGNPDETSVFPQTMLVDYVRVYQRAGCLIAPQVADLWEQCERSQRRQRLSPAEWPAISPNAVDSPIILSDKIVTYHLSRKE